MKIRKNKKEKSSSPSSTLTSIAHSSLSNLNSCSFTNLGTINSLIASLSKSVFTTTSLWVFSFFILHLNLTWKFVYSSHISYFLQFLSCFLLSSFSFTSLNIIFLLFLSSPIFGISVLMTWLVKTLNLFITKWTNLFVISEPDQNSYLIEAVIYHSKYQANFKR